MLETALATAETKDHRLSIFIGNVEFPYPICQVCNKPVDRFFITVNGRFYKFHAECHSGYEFYLIDKHAIDCATSIAQGIAFPIR